MIRSGKEMENVSCIATELLYSTLGMYTAFLMYIFKEVHIFFISNSIFHSRPGVAKHF